MDSCPSCRDCGVRRHRWGRGHGTSLGVSDNGACLSTSTPCKPSAASTRPGGCCRPIQRRWWRASCTERSCCRTSASPASPTWARRWKTRSMPCANSAARAPSRKSAPEYLNDWAANDKAWLRKFYPPGTDEPHFDLTPATERALAWLQTRPRLKISGAASRKAHPSHHCWPICTLRRFVLGWKKLGLERAQPLTLFAPATGAEALARHARPVGRWCALSRFVHGVDHHHGVFRHLHVSLPFVAGKRQQRLIVLLVARSARLRA